MQTYRLLTTALLGALLVGACAPVVSSSTGPVATATVGSPSPSVAVPSTAALEPCHGQQVALTPGYSGAAAGTAYLRVFVELAQNPPCTLPRGPMITVTTDGGQQIAQATQADPSPVALDYIDGYTIAWNAPCGPTPTGALVAHITFSPEFVVDMPLGTFKPSCVDGSTGFLSMSADDRN